MSLKSRSGKVDVAKYVTAILAGFLIWELIALVLGNQPNVVFVRRLVVGERGVDNR